MSNKVLLFFLFGYLISSCSLFEEEPRPVDFANEIWNEKKTTKYEFQYSYSCSCPETGSSIVVVNSERIISVLNPETRELKQVQFGSHPDSMAYILDVYPDYFKTVDGLYDIIYDAKAEKADKIIEVYDAKKGYPKDIFIDYNLYVADEEFGFQISELDFFD